MDDDDDDDDLPLDLGIVEASRFTISPHPNRDVEGLYILQ